MAKDYTIAVEPVLRPVLAPGERLLAAAPVTKDPGTTDDVSVSDDLRNLLDPAIVVGLGAHPGNVLQPAAFGRAVVGGPESPAREVARLVHSISRADIVGAVMAPAGLLRRGWFLVLFADGSLCAVACSVPRLGRQVAEALGPPAP